MKNFRIIISFCLFISLSVFVYNMMFVQINDVNTKKIQNISYKEFKQLLDQGEIKAVTYYKDSDYIKFFATEDALERINIEDDTNDENKNTNQTFETTTTEQVEEKTSETSSETSIETSVNTGDGFYLLLDNPDVKISRKDKEILAKLNSASDSSGNYTIYYTTHPQYEEFEKDALEAGASVTVQIPASTIIMSVLTMLEMLLFVIFVLMLLRSFMGMGSKDGKSGGLGSILNVGDTEIKKQTSTTKFKDVIGHDEIMEDIRFTANLVKNPKCGEDMGVKVPKGMLLTGPPGTGKTLIAKAIAGEADVPFYYFNASNFVEVYVGVGAKRVRKLFAEAKKNAPCVVFIDEIDAVGKKRNEVSGNSEMDQTLLALLQEMDGFTPRTGVFVIAATNKPDSLDSGLVRAGRFDRQIEVNPPRDWKIRKLLFDHYLKPMKVSDDVNTELIARQTSGFTGADIEMVCNEAGIIALMEKRNSINLSNVQEAIDKKVFHGNKSKRKAIENDRQYVAYHEAGHAVMSLLTKTPVARASIVGTTSGVGGAVFHNDKESVFRTVEELRNEVMIAYAGRASEEIKFQVPTTGASNDIQQATNIMIHYIESYGFNENFGLINMGIVREVAPAVEGNIVEQLSNMSRQLYQETKDKLSENYEKVEILAQELLSKETLTGPEIEELLDIKC